MIWTGAWWKAVGERAISTAAQVIVAGWGTSALPDVSLPWWSLPVMGLAAGALSILKSVAASQSGNGSPSLTNSETVT